jgi:hypothetical protein
MASHITSCLQHKLEFRVTRCHAQPPWGGTATQKAYSKTTARLNRLHSTRRLKHSPALVWPHTRHARAPTSPRNTGLCAIWDCVTGVQRQDRQLAARRFFKAHYNSTEITWGGCRFFNKKHKNPTPARYSEQSAFLSAFGVFASSRCRFSGFWIVESKIY